MWALNNKDHNTLIGRKDNGFIHYLDDKITAKQKRNFRALFQIVCSMKKMYMLRII